MADTSTLGPNTGTATDPGSDLEADRDLAPAVLPRGFLIGRYVVLEQIGLGGMGAIYAAYDPELDRRVALKVLRRGTDRQRSGSSAAARLLGEARALARLQHKNVLRVYDVGSDRGEVFVTTELLVGRDVAAWVRQEPRTWEEVVKVFLEVGQGLAAAHAEGLVHCDVKPANMMVCDDGRVLLVDFGIAAEVFGGEGQVVDAETLDLDPIVFGARRSGGAALAGAGTPGYMAPEQARGEDVGPAADIYAYCLSLSRVLFGRAPQEFSASAAPGAIASPSVRAAEPAVSGAIPRNVARRLRRVLAAGTREEIGDRPASIEEVLVALRRVLRLRKRRLIAAGSIALLVLLAALFARVFGVAEGSCFDGERRFDAVFSQERQQALADRFAAQPGGNELLAITRAAIEGYGRAWADQGEAWCREGRRGASSDVLLDLRSACLEQRLRELDASLSLATERKDLASSRLTEMFTGLVSLDVCADTQALRAPVEPVLDAAQVPQLAQLRERQAQLRAFWTAGVMRDGLAAANTLLPEVRALGHSPLEAEVLYQQGLFEDALVADEAEATLRQAALTAGACRHDRVMAEALLRLVRVLGLRRESFAEAERLAGLARVALGNLGRPLELSAQLADYEGLIARQRGDYGAAFARHQAALEARRQGLPSGHPDLAVSHLRLGILLDDQGREPEARGHFEEALRIQIAAYGSSHPTIAETYSRLGTLEREEGSLDSAREYHEKALALRRRVLGDERTPVAESRTYLGELAALRGELELARSEFAAARQILERELGPGHSRLGVVWATQASSFTHAGLDGEAVVAYLKALKLFEQAFGGEHPQVGVLAFNLGAVFLRMGEPARAYETYGRASRLFDKAFGEGSALARNARGGMGESLERLNRLPEARALLEPLLASDRDGSALEDRGPRFRADTAFAMARLLLKNGEEPERARRLALEARDLYHRDLAASRRELQELETWLLEAEAP